jgi:hypothetical protein
MSFLYTLPIFLPFVPFSAFPPINMLDQSDDSIDPAELYTPEMFMAQQSLLDSFGARIEAKIKAKMEAGPSRHSSKYINKNREGTHEQLVADYFAEDPLFSRCDVS